MSNTIVLVDDEIRAMASRLELLTDSFPEAEIVVVETVAEFTERLPTWQRDPPSLFVIDLILPWSRDGSVAPESFEPYAAGLCCVKQLIGHSSTANVPIILFSVHASRVAALTKDVPSNVFAFDKPALTSELADLARAILSAKGATVARQSPLRRRVMDALEIKPGAFGLRVDLKRLLKRRSRK